MVILIINQIICIFRNLPLKLLNVALACNFCQAYFLSIIYLELWAIEEQEQTKATNVEIMSNPQFQEIARKVIYLF